MTATVKGKVIVERGPSKAKVIPKVKVEVFVKAIVKGEGEGQGERQSTIVQTCARMLHVHEHRKCDKLGLIVTFNACRKRITRARSKRREQPLRLLRTLD